MESLGGALKATLSPKQHKRRAHRREQTVWLDTEKIASISSLAANKFDAGGKSSAMTVELVPFILPELRIIAREVLDRQIAEVVRSALSSEGRVTGVVGDLRLEQVRCSFACEEVSCRLFVSLTGFILIFFFLSPFLSSSPSCHFLCFLLSPSSLLLPPVSSFFLF